MVKIVQTREIKLIQIQILKPKLDLDPKDEMTWIRIRIIKAIRQGSRY